MDGTDDAFDPLSYSALYITMYDTSNNERIAFDMHLPLNWIMEKKNSVVQQN